MKKAISLALVFCLLLACAPAAMAAQVAYRVVYNSEAMPDWSPSYGLNAPGMLLHLTKPDADVFVVAYEDAGLHPAEHINNILAGYGDYLNVTETIGPGLWEDPWNGEGRYVDITYTYTEGEETYRQLIYAAQYQSMLIEISFTSWGENIESDVAEFRDCFLDENLDISSFDIDLTATAYLSDVFTGDNGQVQLLVNFFETVYNTETNDFATQTNEELMLYDVSPDAMIWFPASNGSGTSYRVDVNADAIAQAVMDYEENTGVSAAFNLVFRDGEIIWMDYYYLP